MTRNWGDGSIRTRWRRNTIVWSSYNYCGNNPVVFVDPNGMDYWRTSDPGMIALFFNTLRGTNSNPVESFDYSGWAHYTDAEVTSLLTLNDKTKKLWSSYGAVIDDVGSSVGVSLDVEMLLGMAAFVSSRQSVIDRIGRDDWYRRSSGAVQQDYTLEALLLPIGRGIGLVTSGAGKLVGIGAQRSIKLIPQFSTRTIDDAVSIIMEDPNKIAHLFAPHHNLSSVVSRLNGQENTVRAILNAANGRLPSSGVFNNIPVNIGGQTIFIRGNVVNGIPRLGTIFIP